MKILATIALICTSVLFLALNSQMEKTSSPQGNTIVRVWRGWTTIENAAALEKVLRHEAIPSIETAKPRGLKGINLLTLPGKNEVQFTTIMYFESIEAVKEFAGEDYGNAHIDPSVAPLLLRYDKVVEHHTLKETRNWD
jgi:hypothetical protein